jgi:hypothetical protein
MLRDGCRGRYVSSKMRTPTPSKTPTPSNSGHTPAWAAIIIIACLVLFLVALGYAIATGKLMVIGFGALALVVAAICAAAYQRGTDL